MRVISLNAEQMSSNRDLCDEMFCHRKFEFNDRQNWGLRVDYKGRELDEYDYCLAHYLIVVDERGRHIASTRLLPTTGRTMIKEHFSHLIDEDRHLGDQIWECSRFFSRPGYGIKPYIALFAAGHYFAKKMKFSSYVGVTSIRMTKIYTRCGWQPELLTGSQSNTDSIIACLWPINTDTLSSILCKHNIDDVDFSDFRLALPSMHRRYLRGAVA